MRISEKDWVNYIDKLSRVNQKAADKMRKWVGIHGLGDRKALIDYAYAVSATYGEAAAALACEMYDATAVASKANVPAAVPAETASYDDVAKAVNGTLKHSQNTDLLSNAIGRLVKRTGADTTLHNALRDGAEFAWVPHGDTCSFCIALASRGWQRMSKAALKGGHAEHIHANCDCTYEVRFDSSMEVEGYDPDEYLRMYNAAEGSSSKDKINAMRRVQYAANPEKYRKQKRTWYAENVAESKTYLANLKQEENSIKENQYETAVLLSNKGTVIFSETQHLPNGVYFTEEQCKKMKDANLTHNHPSGSTFSSKDVELLTKRELKSIRVTSKQRDYQLKRINGDFQFREKFSEDLEKAKKENKKITDAKHDKIKHLKQSSPLKYNEECAKLNAELNDMQREWLKKNARKYGYRYSEYGR